MTSEGPKILVIGPTPPPYHGVSVMTQNLLRWGVAGPVQILHLELADRRGIQHVSRPDLHDVFLFLRQWTRFLKMLLRERPQMVYLPLSQTTVGFLRDSLFLWPASLRGSRILIHLHGSHFRQWYEPLSPFFKSYVERTLQRVARSIVLSESLRHLFDGIIPEDRISVVPNGVAWGPLKREMKAGSHAKRRRRILHLSTLSRQKGALVTLSAIPLVIEKRRDVEFVFAGDWQRDEDRDAADELIVREGLKDYVTFTGPVAGEGKQKLFLSADLFVFPGIQPEGQPLVILEAMAAGLPVLFTDRGCIGETVIHGENGLKVNVDDPRDLARQILWFLDHPEEMQSMGNRSRMLYESLYTDGHFKKRMTEVIFRTWKE